MSRIKSIVIGLGALALVLSLFGTALAVDIKVVPDTNQVLPGQEIGVNVVLENVPATGLSAVQFRLRVFSPGGYATGVSNLGQADLTKISVAAPLNASGATATYSGLGDLMLGVGGANEVLMLDNQPFRNETVLVNNVPQIDVTTVSALYSFAPNSTSGLIQGSGILARFMIRVGEATTASRLDFSLSEVVVLDGDLTTGPQEYALINTLGSTVALGCQTPVPDLAGMSFDTAQQTLLAVNLAVASVYEIDNSAGSLSLGQVLEQSVTAGTTSDCGVELDLAINQAPAEVSGLASQDLVGDQSGGVTLTWTLSVSSDVAGYEVSGATGVLATLAGGTISTVQLSGLTNDQNNLLTLTAFDTFGNRSAGVVVGATPHDDVLPTLTAAALPGLTNLVDQSLSGTVEDSVEVTIFNLTKVEYPVITYPAPGQWFAVISLNEGENQLQVSARDAADNLTELSLVNLTLDTVPPVVTLNPVDSPTTVDTQNIGGSVEDGASVNVASSTAAGCSAVVSVGTWSCTLTGLVPDANDITVSATDAAGNVTTLNPVTIAYQPQLLDITLNKTLIAANQSETVVATLNLANAGDAVTLEQFADLNDNSLVDAGEPVIRRLNLVDSDNDKILVAAINMLDSLALDHAPGAYIFRAWDGMREAFVTFRVDAVSQSQTLSGRVTDGVAGIAGAQVQLVDKWQRPVAWAIADGLGNYQFQVPAVGKYYLLPQGTGYVFDSATSTLVTVAVGSSASADDLVLTDGTYDIGGQVFAGMTDLAGVRVVASGTSGNSSSASTLTEADGSYNLSLPAGNYLISVPAGSFAGPSQFGALADASTDLPQMINTDLLGIDFELTVGTLTINGQVVDETMMPVAGLSVVAISAGRIVARGISDTSGNYKFNLAQGGSYSLLVDSASSQSIGYLSQTLSGVMVTSALTDQDIQVHVTSSQINGTVTDVMALPMCNLPVELTSVDGLYTISMDTANDGSYQFRTFAGSWHVRATTEQQGYLPVTEAVSVAQPETIDFVAEMNNAPDLKVTVLSGPTGSVNSGSTISMNATIENIGGERATETFFIGYYLSSDAVWDTSDSFLTNAYAYGLAAGASVDLSRNVALPLGTQGTYYIVGKVNYNSTVPDESDLSNNSLASAAFNVNL
ncbi:MAG: carboxypeptidase regulatory-like domain-containing protein [Geopsychrobacter sp.]|nr:carboxypeptidase regulatory-like domain-containing protein [Geopsychrobacter sp.]